MVHKKHVDNNQSQLNPLFNPLGRLSSHLCRNTTLL